jgi:hypothetical protein
MTGGVAVADELRWAAAQLEAEAAGRLRLAAQALATWTGPRADVYADELRRRSREAADLAAACRRAAATVDSPTG